MASHQFGHRRHCGPGPSPCSAAVTRPRCRDGTARSSWRGNAPSTRRPTASQACLSTCSCRGVPTRLRITPPIRSPGWKVENPCNTAARLWLWPRASTTISTGAPSAAATCAGGAAGRDQELLVDPAVEQAHHPSTTAMSASAGAVPVQRTDHVLPTNTGSRLRPGRPARQW